jgi:hypothetical protein
MYSESSYNFIVNGAVAIEGGTVLAEPPEELARKYGLDPDACTLVEPYAAYVETDMYVGRRAGTKAVLKRARKRINLYPRLKNDHRKHLASLIMRMEGVQLEGVLEYV